MQRTVKRRRPSVCALANARPFGAGAPHKGALNAAPALELAAPWDSKGGSARLDHFNNLLFTVLPDATNLTTPGLRALLTAGNTRGELLRNYVVVGVGYR